MGSNRARSALLGAGCSLFALTAPCAEAQTPPSASPPATDLGSVGTTEGAPAGAVAPSSVGDRAQAKEQKKEAPNVIEVQPYTEIEKLPEQNLAESLQRVPGVSLESDSGRGRFINIRGIDADQIGTLYDGVVLTPSNQASPLGGGRAFAFDAIPPGIVGGIQVIKSLTPDIDATGLGGTVNLLPRELPPDGQPFLDADLNLGWEALRRTAEIQGYLTAGTTFGLDGDGMPWDPQNGDRQFSIIGTFSRYDYDRGIDDVEESYSDTPGVPNKALQNLQLTRALPSIAYGLLVAAGAVAAEVPDEGVPRYDHILVIIAENQSYGAMMEGDATPNLKKLAETYGVASNFFAAVHPSEGNYIAMVGGSTFGVHDDDAFYCKPGSRERYCDKSGTAGYADHTIAGRSLVDQLEEHHLAWKGYFQDLPEPGSLAIRDPDPDALKPGQIGALYAAKHNGFISFARVQNDPERALKLVGFDQLDRDLAAGEVPAYAHIVPNQCDDMHGLEGPDVPADCAKDNEPGRRARGDAMIMRLVEKIQQSPIWAAPGNTAIVVTFDEDGKPRDPADPQGCCGFQPGSPAEFGGGHIATIVITNHGVRGVIDPTPYSHYSLLRTTEDAFGIAEHLNHAGDSEAGVVPMASLFAVSR